MKSLIAGFVALLFAATLTLWVKEDNGYVLIGYGHWTIEGSLALFVLAGALLFVLFYLLLRSLSRLWAFPGQVHDWRGHRRTRKAQQALTQGLVELSEGRWEPAEKHLLRYASESETPLLNYLAAARAAQLQGAHERRDHYLNLAHESMPAADVAVGLTQAELQLAHQQYEQALATLMHVRTLAPKHAYVLKLLKKLYEDLGEWDKLEGLLPELRRRKVISQDEQLELESRVYLERLRKAAGESDQLVLLRLWNHLPRSLRGNQALVEAYCELQIERGTGEQAERIIIDYLRHTWSDRLVTLFAAIGGGDPAQRLALAESWLPAHADDPVLLLTLARLCLHCKLWGKARSYLEARIGLAPSPEAYRELGALLERMDESEAAMDCYRSGLSLTAGPATLQDTVKQLPASTETNTKQSSELLLGVESS